MTQSCPEFIQQHPETYQRLLDHNQKVLLVSHPSDEKRVVVRGATVWHFNSLPPESPPHHLVSKHGVLTRCQMAKPWADDTHCTVRHKLGILYEVSLGLAQAVMSKRKLGLAPGLEGV